MQAEINNNGWRHLGQSEQRKSSVLFPIQSEKSPGSGFFAYLWKKGIMPSSRKQITEITGEGVISGYFCEDATSFNELQIVNS